MKLYSRVLKHIAYLQLRRELNRYAKYGFTMISVRSLQATNIEAFKTELISDGFSLGYANNKLELIIWA